MVLPGEEQEDQVFAGSIPSGFWFWVCLLLRNCAWFSFCTPHFVNLAQRLLGLAADPP